MGDKLEFIGLLHTVDWNLPEVEFLLDSEVRLCKYKNSKVARLVDNLAKTKDLDDGEPLNYGAVVVQSSELDFRGGIIDLVCSLLGVVCLGCVPVLTNIICTSDYNDGFIVESITDIRKQQNEFIYNTMHEKGIEIKINQETTQILKVCWDNLKMDQCINFNRIENSLRYYTQAWKSNTEEEAMLNLCIALETLFAPSSQNKLSHQIAMSASRLLRKTPAKRKETYELSKIIYRERSKIIHGATPSDWGNFSKYLWEAYALSAESIRFILADKRLTDIFKNDELRREFIDSLQIG
jgi:hypothetical protein